MPNCAEGTNTPVTATITLSDPVNGKFRAISEQRDGATYTGWPVSAAQTASPPAAPQQPTAPQLGWTCRIIQPYTYPDGTTAGVPAVVEVTFTNPGGVAAQISRITLGYSGYGQSQFGNLGGIPRATYREVLIIPAQGTAHTPIGGSDQAAIIRVNPVTVFNGPTACRVIRWAA